MKVSFDSLNFSVRPNKHIERRLVFDALRLLDAAFPINTYQYIGFGALWFADFILAHRDLGITAMTSIQKGQKEAARSRFNRPYAGIQVIEGEASIVLPDLDLESRRSILWLDYEGRIDAILEETAAVCRRLPTGSVFIVTINASKDTIDVEEEARRQNTETEVFKRLVGPLAPSDLPVGFYETKQYPKHLAVALSAHLFRQTRLSGRDLTFRPLFNFAYSDGAPMVTVGGMISTTNDSEALDRLMLARRLWYVGENQIVIAAPPLTTREKLALDQVLPSSEPPDETTLAKLGFSLKPAQMRAYHAFYSRYPVFGEWQA